MRRVSLVLAAWLLSFSCDLWIEDYTPERLSGIPSTAVWAGGPDGGAWFECFVDTSRNANWCTVWDDQSGRVIARTQFVEVTTGAGVPVTALQYCFFSGTFIELLDGRRLEPLSFHGKDAEPPAPVEPLENAPTADQD